jgi:hypothetical protein
MDEVDPDQRRAAVAQLLEIGSGVAAARVEDGQAGNGQFEQAAAQAAIGCSTCAQKRL